MAPRSACVGIAVPVTCAGMLSKAKRLLRTPADELVGRVAQRVHAVSERFLPRPLRASIDGQQSATDVIVSLVSGRSNWRFTDGASPSESVARLRTQYPSDETRVLEAAQRIVRGELPVLGHGWIKVGSPPRWNREPLAGLDTPLDHWSRIDYLNRSVAGDHKVLWEFNRHQHLVTLAQAWQYSRSAQLLETITCHLQSWLEHNPPGQGANWASSLEVAYRSISWCWALRLLNGIESPSSQFEPALADRLLASIDAHGRHVSRYLSTWFSPNTHLTGEALGLVYLGCCFPALTDASRWCALGIDILEAEAGKQVYSDGVYFEQATQYHRYTAEIYLHYVLLMRSRGESVSERVLSTLHRLFDVLLALSRADGSMALLGDDDGGRLVQLDDRAPHDLRSLLGTGAAVLERSDLAWAGRGDDASMIWLLGPRAIDQRDALIRQPPAEVATAFREGGIFAVRDGWSRPSGHATISCGPHGALSCGHSHADALSVELFSSNGPLLVDKGTLAYDGPERDEFRATAAHNTLELGAIGASEPSTPFRWQSFADAELDTWMTSGDMSWFSGHHDGYRRLRTGLRHSRGVWHPASGVWHVEDAAAEAEDVDFALRWHLAPGVTATTIESWPSGVALALVRNGIPIASLLMTSSTAGVFSLDRDRVSPQYGCVLEANTVRWSGSASRDFRVRSVVIDWGSLKSNGVLIQGIPEHGELRLSPQGTTAIPIDSTSVLHLDPSNAVIQHELTVTANASWYEPEIDGRRERCVAIGAESVRIGARELMVSASAGSWMAAERTNGQWSPVAIGDASVRGS